MYQRLLFLMLLLLVRNLHGQSILSSGEWYKIGVTKSGIYKIDRGFLSEAGINTDNLDPRTLKIYGKGVDGMLPQKNSIVRPNDPVQLSIYGSGAEDGTMDESDYFLFYGASPDRLSVNPDGSIFYEKNLYCDTAYYFITHGGADGKRITSRSSATASATIVTTFRELIAHEKDELSFKKTGRLWLESSFTSGSSQRSYRFQAAGIVDSVFFDFHVVAESQGLCTFDVFYNEQLLGSIPIEGVIISDETTYDDWGKETFKRMGSPKQDDTEITVNLKFNRTAGAATSVGYLDYFVISFDRVLGLYEDQTMFHTRSSTGSLTYSLSETPQDVQVWDLRDSDNPVNQKYIGQGSGISFTLAENTGAPFLVFKENNLPKPSFFHALDNQDIKALAGNEGLIITYPAFADQAFRLADFHRQHSGLSVGVVTTGQVYNEFSAGAQDLTAIRDYLKYCYESGGNLRYALLFGDASYDYKNRISKNTNFVPVYESRESFHPIFSHSSDDYFGFFEVDEGEWLETKDSDHTLEIGIGRIPVKSPEEATNVVDKIIRYKTSDKAMGKWRNEIAYLSDDGDRGVHMDQAEKLFRIIDTSYLQYNAKKIYLDAFDQEPGKYGASPQTTDEFLRTIKEGVLILDYMGHGNENELMHERVITQSVLKKLANRQKLPLFVTATCTFGRYDDPLYVSGSENLLLNPEGGAIGILTTTRFVYANTNLMVNQAFHENVFRKINGKHPRLGDVIRATKNQSLSGPVNRNFALLGDPMLRLNYPEYEIIFDQMTFEDDTTGTMQDTLSALEKYYLSGSIRENGQLISAFNGQGIITLWDIPQDKVTKGQENGPFRYQVQTNALFRGEVTVKNGEFSLEFILPKNISYKYQPGKLTMYAWNEDDYIDAAGATRTFVLGGTASDVTPDNRPPSVSMYLNDPSFKNGGTVGTSSLLVARVSDESGINISNNGFNQSITLTLNNQEPLELNAFYTADRDNYTEGTILFPLQNLQPGKYNVILKVWDTHNNPSMTTVEFNVSDAPVIRLYNTKHYPNPVLAHEEATFEFEHDREGEKLQIVLSIYSMRGSQVYIKNYVIDNSPKKVDDLIWNIRSTSGGDLEKGIYVYRLHVTSTFDGASNEVVNRLIIIN